MTWLGWTVAEWVTRVSLLLAGLVVVAMCPYWAELAHKRRKQLLEETDEEEKQE